MNIRIAALFLVLLITVTQAEMGQAQNNTFTNSIGMEFVLIPAGQFTFTWTAKDDFGDEVTRRKAVTISRPFYLGKYEVTQEQWVAVMGEGSNKSCFKARNKPVENVTWHDAQAFAQKMSLMENGKKYRLPTEAEWEHAARAGTETEWFFGDDASELGQYGWSWEYAKGATRAVGQKKPNPWGLYDIYGNVWEWVQDWEAGDGPQHEWYKAGDVTDPTGPISGTYRVRRGGSWNEYDIYCSSGYRYYHTPATRNDFLGFRLALYPDEAELTELVPASPQTSEASGEPPSLLTSTDQNQRNSPDTSAATVSIPASINGQRTVEPKREVSSRNNIAQGSRREIPPEKARYLLLIRDTIGYNWPPNSTAGSNLSVSCTITIEPSGQVSDMSIYRSSGDRDFDLSLEQAINKSSPFPPLPQIFENKQQKIRLSFAGRPEAKKQIQKLEKRLKQIETKAVAVPPSPTVFVSAFHRDGRKVNLGLKITASGVVAVVTGLRLDNVGGRSTLWRSDGRQAGAGLIRVSRHGTQLTDGTRPMAERVLLEGLELELELEDDGAFSEGETDFRLTVFLADGKRVSNLIKQSDFTR